MLLSIFTSLCGGLLLSVLLQHCSLIAGQTPPAGSNRYLVIVLNRLGLANRLRSVADWYEIALLSNRVLIVSWHPTSDCNATFSDLFESAPERLKVLPYLLPFDSTEAISMLESKAREENVSFITLDKATMFVRGRDSFILRRDDVMSDAQTIITSYDGVLTLDGVKCQQYLSMRSQLLSSLVPVKDARDLVKEVVDTYFRDKVMIGVHYRAHDKVQDWEVVPPLEGQTSAMPFGVGATLQDFELYMKNMQSAFTTTSTTMTGENSTTVSATTSRFFIASNSPEAKQYFASKFPDSIFISGDYRRDSRDGILFALLEWLLLSQSALLLNTYGSSYAMEAAQVHLRPLVGVWGGMIVHHTDMRLPFCGHMLYMKEFSRRATDTTYTEGTSDNREVRLDARCDLSMNSLTPSIYSRNDYHNLTHYTLVHLC
jgi:hypothetical protein